MGKRQLNQHSLKSITFTLGQDYRKAKSTEAKEKRIVRRRAPSNTVKGNQSSSKRTTRSAMKATSCIQRKALENEPSNLSPSRPKQIKSTCRNALQVKIKDEKKVNVGYFLRNKKFEKVSLAPAAVPGKANLKSLNMNPKVVLPRLSNHTRTDEKAIKDGAQVEKTTRQQSDNAVVEEFGNGDSPESQVEPSGISKSPGKSADIQESPQVSRDKSESPMEPITSSDKNQWKENYD